MDQEIFKVVISGPFGAGKTTFVKAIAADATGSERGVTDATAALKAQTTVAMDHGSARLDDGTVVSVFGTPGQERFSFMWPVLAKGMRAYALLVDASRLQAQAQLKSILRQFRGFAPEVPFLIAANRWDQATLSREALAEFIGVEPRLIVAHDPRDEREAHDLLTSLVGMARSLEYKESA